MAGPSLKLGVTGTGKETIDGLNAALDRLRGNLAALKVAKPDLGSLESLTSEFKRFRSEFSEIAQAQRTAFTDLAETLKTGFSKAASSARAGAADLDAALAKGGTDGKSGIPAFKARLMVGAASLVEAAETAGNKQRDAMFAWKAKLMVGAAAISEAQDLAAAKASSSALAWQAKLQLGSLKIQEAIQAAESRESAAKLAWTAKMQLGALKIAESQEAAAVKAASGALAWQAKMQLGSLKIAESIEAAAAREDAARRAWILKMQAGSAQIAAEQVAAANRELDGIRKAEAAYAARTDKQQLRTQVRARAQLDAGRSLPEVEAAFGPTATGAAAAAGSLQRLKQEAGETTPKLKGMADAMRDGHSAARGLASGFNAMFLTWGNLGPLLAGAALSNAFVQTVKVGADVAHELAVVKVLGEETAQSVGELNDQLLQMARTGPFGPRQISEAFKQLTLAGLSVKEQKTAILDVTNFAVAGTTTIDRAAQSMVQIATAFGYGAEGFGRVGDVISKAAAVSLSSVESLTQSMQSASEVHILYGQSLVDVATNLAVLSQLGIRGTAAGTALKNMYAELSGSTSIVRRNMVAWKVDALDPQTGKIKELLLLIKELAEKYNSLKGLTQMRFIQDLSNTRGGRDLVALVTAFNTQAKDSGDEGLNQLENIRKKIDESYGYQAIAAARLGLTAKNQMASVASSFQASLADAFTGLEPAILSISTRLRETFGSQQFQANVQNLAVAVGNLGVFLVSHLDTIKNLAIAYLSWKAAMFTSTMLTAAIGGIAALSAAYRGLTAAKTADTVATEANAVAGAAAAASGLRGLARFIPVIGGVLAGGILAWDLYWASASGKKNNAVANAQDQHRALLANLQQQVANVRSNVRAMQGLTAFDEFNDAQTKGKQALESLDADIVVKGKAVADAQAALDRRLKGAKGAGSLSAETNPYVVAARSDLAAAQKSYDEAMMLRLQTKEAMSELRKQSAVLSTLADAQANAPKPQGEGERPLKPEAAGSIAGNLKSEFAEREKTLKEQFAFEQKIVDESNRTKQLSDEGRAVKTLDIAERQYAAEMTLLQEYKTKFEGLRGQMAKEGKISKGNAETVAIDEMLKRLDMELVQRKKLAEVKAAGSDNIRDRAMDAELEKLARGVDLQEQQMEAKLAYDRLLPEEQVALQARNAEFEKYNSLIEKTQLAIADLTRDISKEAEGDVMKRRLQARVVELEDDLSRIREQQQEQSNRAGEIAARSVAPQWKKDAEEWGNAMRMMRKSYDDMITGVVQKGQDMWMKFVQTGKLSGKEMLAFIRDELAKSVYQQQIAPYFRDFGKMIAGAAYGRRETTTGDFSRVDRGQPDETSPVKTVIDNAKRMFDDIRGAANPLTDALTRMGESVWDSIRALMRWVNELLNSGSGGGSSSGGGLSGLVSLIGSVFTQDTTQLATGDFARMDRLVPSAAGNAFSGGLMQYAKGDVFDRPTLFRFAQGAGFGLGEMGEAGPEAVMPLKRGAGGALGVVAHGGGGSDVSIVIENHGAQIKHTETRRADGKREVKLMVNAAVAEVDRRIARGGSTAASLKGAGVSMTGRLPRRG